MWIMLNKFQEISTFTELLIITRKYVRVQNCSVYLISTYGSGKWSYFHIRNWTVIQTFKQLFLIDIRDLHGSSFTVSILPTLRILPILPQLQARQTRPNSAKFRGGGCNIFYTFYALKIEFFLVFTLSDWKRPTFKNFTLWKGPFSRISS